MWEGVDVSVGRGVFDEMLMPGASGGSLLTYEGGGARKCKAKSGTAVDSPSEVVNWVPSACWWELKCGASWLMEVLGGGGAEGAAGGDGGGHALGGGKGGARCSFQLLVTVAERSIRTSTGG